MSVYKQFLSPDIVVTPFKVNKDFSFQGTASLTDDPSVGIDRFIGNISNLVPIFNPSSSIYPSGYDFSVYNEIPSPYIVPRVYRYGYSGSRLIYPEIVTGQIKTQFQRLIYHSIKQLYYSNYLSSSYGDIPTKTEIILGSDRDGDVMIGPIHNPIYDNYLQTTQLYRKYFPTGSDNNNSASIGVISIPTRLFGDYIKPTSFMFSTESGSLTDDGNGNIYFSSSYTSSVIVGNIFYAHGLITIIGNEDVYSHIAEYGNATYDISLYGGGGSFNSKIIGFIESPNVTMSFASTYTIHETQYKCTIHENEFNSTLNPSTSSGSIAISSSIGTFYSPNTTLYNFATSSVFSPYITTVGLYNNNKELLAIAKLSQPLPSSPTTDTTIIINLDR